MKQREAQSAISHRRAATLLLGFLVLVIGALGTTSFVAAGDSGNTKGRVPDAAFREDGSIDLTLVPDYVAVWAADGVTIGGYVEQRYLFPKDGAVSPARDEQPIPVVGDDLATIVGHLVNDKGFVPVGVGPETIPAANAVVKP